MFLELLRVRKQYQRPSKLGIIHSYSRLQTMAHLLCDQCGLKFLRNIGKMNKKRLSNDFYHVCTNCDAKRFAQSKGVERRKIWNMSADADIDITKL